MGKYEINHAKFVVRAVSARKNGNIYLSDKIAVKDLSMAQETSLNFKKMYPDCEIEIINKKGKILEVI